MSFPLAESNELKAAFFIVYALVLYFLSNKSGHPKFIQNIWFNLSDRTRCGDICNERGATRL